MTIKQQLEEVIELQITVYAIEVDGGINPHTAKICSDAGADVLVAGNAVFKGEKNKLSYKSNIDALRNILT